jgi:hypothetical protein
MDKEKQRIREQEVRERGVSFIALLILSLILYAALFDYTTKLILCGSLVLHVFKGKMKLKIFDEAIEFIRDGKEIVPTSSLYRLFHAFMVVSVVYLIVIFILLILSSFNTELIEFLAYLFWLVLIYYIYIRN